MRRLQEVGLSCCFNARYSFNSEEGKVEVSLFVFPLAFKEEASDHHPLHA